MSDNRNNKVAISNLDEVRIAIDELDDELVRLLVKRFDLAVQAARIKAGEGRVLFDGDREKLILDLVRERAQSEGIGNQEDLEALARLFADLLKESKVWQDRHLKLEAPEK